MGCFSRWAVSPNSMFSLKKRVFCFPNNGLSVGSWTNKGRYIFINRDLINGEWNCIWYISKVVLLRAGYFILAIGLFVFERAVSSSAWFDGE
jgi:hypothetical protein